jgi:hypothetical protein
MHAKKKQAKTGSQAPDVEFTVQSSISVSARILPELFSSRRCGSGTGSVGAALWERL